MNVQCYFMSFLLGTSNQKKAVIGVTTVAAAAVLIVVIAFLYRKGRDTGTVETVESV